MNFETAFSISTASAVLAAAAVCDIRYRRIPNVLTGFAILFGFGFHLAVSGVEGLLFSVFGCGTGLALLLIPYCVRAMGAGDVKLMMAAGAMVGSTAALYGFVYTALWGGLIGMWMMMNAGMLQDFCTRLYLLSSQGSFSTSADSLRLEASACPPMPYGFVIALGFCTQFAVITVS